MDPATRPTEPTPPPHGAAMIVGEGAKIGRYLVLRALSDDLDEPTVAAWDGELGRTVAIKLLAIGAGDARVHARQEAQLLARLTHPNVLRVHDVGEHEGRLYIVMDDVEDGTLADVPATTREGLATWIAAGRGLAAGHRAGVVHGDFRPRKVLVGDDRRPRVSGFARRHKPAAVAYAAIEVLGGEAADASSDQFSYCVALFEALCGVPPFPTSDVEGRVDAITRAQLPTTVALAMVPRRIRRAIVRGLSASRTERFPTMDALLAELEPRRRARWLLLPTATVAAVAVVLLQPPRAVEPVTWCAEIETRADALWSDERAQRVEAAFVATGVAFAFDEYERAVALVGERADALRAAERSTCEMTASGTLTEKSGSSRQLCLHMQHEQLAGLADMFERADVNVVEHASDVARSLPMVATCLEAQGVISDAATHDEGLNEIAGVVARAKIAAEAWRDEVALSGADEAAAAATERGAHWLAAEAHSIAGRVLERTQNESAAMTRFDASFSEALAADHHAAAVIAALGVATVLGERGDHEGALRWLSHAEAAARRVTGDHGQLDGSILSTRASIAYQHQDFAEAKRLYGEMLARDGERPDLAGLSTTKLNFGLCEANLGNPDAAIVWLEEALAAEIEAHGPDHPSTLRPLNAICHVQTDRGETEDAIVACRRAIDVARTRYTGAQPMMSSLYTNLGSAHFHGGQPGPAETAHLAALDNAMRSQPDDDRLIATIANNLGVLYDSLERVEEAAVHYELAHRRILQGFGPDHPATAMVATNLAMVRVKQGDLDGAVALIEDGMKRMSARLGPEHPDLALSHAELGRIAAKRGDHQTAVASFSRAYDLRSRHGGDDVELADTSWGLAIALSDTGAPAAQVAAKVEIAAALYRAAGGQWAERAARVEGWYATVQRPS